jgi:hypothetical protein
MNVLAPRIGRLAPTSRRCHPGSPVGTPRHQAHAGVVHRFPRYTPAGGSALRTAVLGAYNTLESGRTILTVLGALLGEAVGFSALLLARSPLNEFDSARGIDLPIHPIVVITAITLTIGVTLGAVVAKRCADTMYWSMAAAGCRIASRPARRPVPRPSRPPLPQQSTMDRARDARRATPVHRSTRRLTAALAAASLSLAGCASQSAPPIGGGVAGPTCTKQSVPVNLDPGSPTVYHIVGWLCVPDNDAARSHTVQLLVSGLTFSHAYWDSEYQPATYSYVEAANRRGYATFNIDRIGVGQSDHPPAELLTLQAHAYTISQIVKDLRTGTIGGVTFDTVIGVGHSLGAGILQYEAGTVTDRGRVPDLLILTGYLTKTDPTVVAAIGQALHPATEDAAFAGDRLPPGYLTTRPGERTIFLDPSDVDPGMVAADEAEKQTSSMAERTTVSAARDPQVMHAIAAPILVIVGQHDRLGCDDAIGLSCADTPTILRRESNNFPSAGCLAAYVLPGAGHAINLHRNAHAAYDAGNDWIDDRLAHKQSQSLGSTCTPPTTPHQRW